MAYNTKIQLLLAKIETTYATDPAPTGAQAVLISDLKIDPLQHTIVERDYQLSGFALEGGFPAEQMARVSFAVDFASSGDEDTPPAFGPILRACGLLETITADTSVAYTPLGSGFESVTLYAFEGDTRHKIVGARGTVALDAQPGRLPKLKFEMLGLYAAPGDVSPPTPTYTAQASPKPISKAASVFSVNSVTLALHSLNFQMATAVQYRDKPNYEAVDIEDRKSAGSLSLHKPALSAFDVFTLATTPTLIPISLQHFTVGNHNALLSIGQAQIKNPSYDRDGNQRLVSFGFDVRRHAGNPDFLIQFS